MDISFWHFLWMTLVAFLWVAFLVIFFNVMIDIFRSRDFSGWAKASWVILCVVVPLIGVLIYVIVRGDDMADRVAPRGAADESGGQGLGGSPASDIADAKALRDAGLITQEEFEARKARALG